MFKYSPFSLCQLRKLRGNGEQESAAAVQPRQRGRIRYQWWGGGGGGRRRRQEERTGCSVPSPTEWRWGERRVPVDRRRQWHWLWQLVTALLVLLLLLLLFLAVRKKNIVVCKEECPLVVRAHTYRIWSLCQSVCVITLMKHSLSLSGVSEYSCEYFVYFVNDSWCFCLFYSDVWRSCKHFYLVSCAHRKVFVFLPSANVKNKNIKINSGHVDGNHSGIMCFLVDIILICVLDIWEVINARVLVMDRCKMKKRSTWQLWVKSK